MHPLGLLVSLLIDQQLLHHSRAWHRDELACMTMYERWYFCIKRRKCPLEKRLLQARRISRSRVSMHAGGNIGPQDEGAESLLLEKDKEIEELKARLDDQMRMVTALRSAARKRDMLEVRKSQTSEVTERPNTSR